MLANGFGRIAEGSVGILFLLAGVGKDQDRLGALKAEVFVLGEHLVGIEIIERAVALGDGKLIDVADLPPSVVALAPSLGSDGSPTTQNPTTSTDLEDIERATIQRVFEQVNGDKVMAGKMLGISRATLYRKLKRYNIAVKLDSGVGEPETVSQ